MGLWVVVVAVLVAFGAGYAVARRFRRKDATGAIVVAPPQRYSFVAPEETYTRVTFDAGPALDEEAEWRAAMRAVGDRLRAANVALVVFAHGTFVGEDPFTLARLLGAAGGAPPASTSGERALGGVAPSSSSLLAGIERTLRRLTRAQATRWLGDLANFDDAYVRAFEEAIGGGVACLPFVWSGENHHLGRVQGAARLARAIEAARPLSEGQRVLLVGHSHAGQLFAILTQLIARSEGHDEIAAAAAARGEDAAALARSVEALRRAALDVVTFGTPPRYGWALGGKHRVMHVVNHREGEARGGWLGALHTKDGDYVHHLGVAGSDFPALTARERAINARLDRVLGDGTNLRAWLRNVAARLRVPQYGHTYLVDYGDAATVVPNFVGTILGHGVYTRREAMLFHARLVADHFYPDKPSRVRAWSERARARIDAIRRHIAA